MNRGMPSLTALLGMLALAGYQNRDKLAELLGGYGRPSGQPAQAGATGSGSQGGLGSILHNLRNLLASPGGAVTSGGFLSNALNDLVERFRQNGQEETAQSWIKQGPNAPVEPSQLATAIGPDLLEQLSEQTGMPISELIDRLSRELPTAVDKYTPDGRIPEPTSQIV